MMSTPQSKSQFTGGLLVGKNIYIHCDTGTTYPVKIELLIHKLKAKIESDSTQKVCPTDKANDSLNKPSLSRGQAMLMALNRSNSSVNSKEAANKSLLMQESKDLLVKARMIGIKIVSVEMFLNWIENLPIQYRARLNVDNELSEDFDEDLRDPEKDRLTGVRQLQRPCIKIVDIGKKYRPVFLEQTNYLPYIFPNSIFPKSKKSQIEICPNLDPLPDKPDNLAHDNNPKPHDNQLVKTKSEPKIKQNSIKKRRNSSKKRKDDQVEEPSGFCECCSTSFKNLLAHLNSKDHQDFASNRENFRLLDDVLKKVKTFEEFSQTLSLQVSHTPKDLNNNNNTSNVKITDKSDVNSKNTRLLCSCRKDSHPYPLVSLADISKDKSQTISNTNGILSPVLPVYYKTCSNCEKPHIPSNLGLENELKTNIFLGVNFEVDSIAKNCHDDQLKNSSLAESPPLLSDQVYELSDSQIQSVQNVTRASENLLPPTLSSPTSFMKSKHLEASAGEVYHGNLISFMDKTEDSLCKTNANDQFKPLEVEIEERHTSFEEEKENIQISNIKVYPKRNAAKVARESISLSVKALYSPGGLDRIGVYKPSHQKPILIEEVPKPVSILCNSLHIDQKDQSSKQLSIEISFKEPSVRDPLGLLDQNSMQDASNLNPSSFVHNSFNSISRISSISQLERSRSSFILHHKSGDLWQLADVINNDSQGNSRAIPKLILRRKRPNFETEDIESPNLSYFQEKAMDVSVMNPPRVSNPRKELFCSTPLAKRPRR